MSTGSAGASAQTPWLTRSRRLAAPLRDFVRTEVGGAAVLVAAVLAALVWANVAPASYEGVWTVDLSVGLGHHEVVMALREWVNQGLMTLFFLVVGLEARRELDLGDLRDRKRSLVPVAAGLLGLGVPVAIYAAINHGGPGAPGWGVAMSSDTALALGLLALLGSRVPDPVRLFLLTVFVVDDLVALLVIAVFYSSDVSPALVGVAAVVFVVFVLILRLGVDRPLVYVLLGVAVWLALLESGVDPVVAGLAIGLTASAYPPRRDALEDASTRFRRFREEPTPELARTASVGLVATQSPNARLQRFYLPWTTYLIVPLFGLANAGLTLDAAALGHAVRSPVTWGVVLAYLIGKPVGVVGATWLTTRLSGGRVQVPVGWGAVLGSGAAAGAGFTVSLLIATIVFTGPTLTDAKIGVLVAVGLAALSTTAVFEGLHRLPLARRARLLLGDADSLVDLAVPVDPKRDHVRGSTTASVTLVEYGDFECPHCGQAEPSARAQLADDQDLRFVWRHLPLVDVHPHAQLAAEVSEVAAASGAFWEMHDLLLARQEALTMPDLLGYAEQLGLDPGQVRDGLDSRHAARRVARDVESADLSAVSGTPTFFVNGRRHYGAYDEASLRAAITTARVRALRTGSAPGPE